MTDLAFAEGLARLRDLRTIQLDMLGSSGPVGLHRNRVIQDFHTLDWAVRELEPRETPPDLPPPTDAEMDRAFAANPLYCQAGRHLTKNVVNGTCRDCAAARDEAQARWAALAEEDGA